MATNALDSTALCSSSNGGFVEASNVSTLKQRKKLSSRKRPRRKKPSTTIHDLPNTIINKIFSYLSVRQRFSVELVCKKWHLIGKLLPWKNPAKLIFTDNKKLSSFQFPCYELTDSILVNLLCRGGFCLEELTLVFKPIYVGLTIKTLEIIGKFCPNLEKLYIQNVPINSDGLKKLANGCVKLKECNIEYTRLNGLEMGMLAIVRNCKMLELLSLHDMVLSNEWFDVVNPSLKRLILRRIAVSPAAWKNLTVNCNALQELNVVFYPDSEEPTLLFQVLQHFKETLKRVRICFLASNADCRIGLNGLHNLEELSLICSLDDERLEFIVKTCPKLRKLNIARSLVSDSAVSTLNHLQHLKELNLDGCYYITDDGLEAVVNRGILEVLFTPCLVSEDFCCRLAKICPNLRHLDVCSDGDRITDRLVTAFRIVVRKRIHSKPMKIVVNSINVSKDVKRCPGLIVEFRRTCQRDCSVDQSSSTASFIALTQPDFLSTDLLDYLEYSEGIYPNYSF